MQRFRLGLGLLAGFLAIGCGGLALGQVVRHDAAKEPVRGIEREFDPDEGGEAPYYPTGEEGEVAATDNCETVGAFSSTFQFSNRYRGNLYRIIENGVFLREIKMQLAFAGTANLFVSAHKKQPDGSYLEVDINGGSPTQGYIFIGNAQGLGANTAAFYTTGPINNGAGVELTPGDYAIGFAWASETIKFGRDASTYPKPLSVGATMASVSRDVFANEPPLPSTLPSLTQFSGGAYSMQICFVPTVGACCLSAGAESRCENLLESQCVGEGSYFHGQRTTCKDTICEFGACCFECDTAINGFVAKCRDNYVTQSCAAAQGSTNFEVLAVCPTDDSELCPKLVGACCNGTSCSLKCETECVAGGGTYEGDGTDCDPNTHVCKGACCITGGCIDRTQAGCASSNGQFHGRGTRCFSEECGGACCYGFSQGLEFCEIFDQRSLCSYDPEGFPFIAYRGDGTLCTKIVGGEEVSACETMASYKACCLPDGSCMNTTQAVCTAPWIQGTFVSAGTCATIAPNQCPNLVSRCCFNDGSCDLISGNACTARGGSPVVGQTTCPSGACNSLAGACCTNTGVCSMKTATQCNTDEGFYQGDDTCCTGTANCDAPLTCPVYGACCRANGDCLENQTPAQCATVEGAFGGPASTCAAANCDQRGACCAKTGTCLRTTAGTCAGLEDAEFKGVGVQCAPGVCPSGACCVPEGCNPRTPAGCAADGGDYVGTGTTCNIDTCLIQGGCCRQGACTVEPPASCADGDYLGNGTNCDGTPCTLGACCRIDGTCEDNAQQGGCAGPGEEFTAAGTCLNANCIAQGACCVVGAECAVAAQAACTGQYMGDGVECGFGVCPATGACCNGATCTLNTQAGCVSGGGTYQGDNTLCGTGTCTATPTGACCNGSTCSVTTQAGCSGTYKGDGTTCAANPCQAAQCTAITATSPANCSIDARRPYPPNIPGSPEGANFIDLTFNCDTSGHTAGNYSVTVQANGTPPPFPQISSVVPNGQTVRLNLSSRIPAGAWTCFTYTPSSLMKCIGFLPGDVDNNRTTAPVDILKLIDNLNGIVVPALTADRCDMDRSGACLPADIITLIDMLNGTNGFIVWNGKTLPTCPSP